MKVQSFLSSLALMAAASAASAQTGYINSGNLQVQLTQNFSNLIASQNIGFILTKYTDKETIGKGFAVKNSGVQLSTGAGSALTRGSITFSEGGSVVVLQNLQLIGSPSKPFIYAEVYFNGTDEGNFNVFTLDSDPYVGPVAYGEYISKPVNFRINPDFVSEFDDYIPITGFDPTSVIGTFQIDVMVTKS